MKRKKDKNTSAARLQAARNYAAMEQDTVVVPDYIKYPYYGTSLCPLPRYRRGGLTRRTRGGEADGKDGENRK